jgi:1-acyl-sn-glycerol-3-phosphate acyltransferase
MAERLFYGWRLLATGLCFVMFGAGGILLRLVGFPLLNGFVRDKSRRAWRARKMIQTSFRLFVGFMHGLGVLRYEIEGLERLDRTGLLILANHPSLIDTVFLMAITRRADCIVKAALQTNVFTRGPVTSAGYIFNDHGVELVDDCVRSLKSGSNLIVFPEGTRTAPDGVLRLKRGAAHIALRAQCDITPVVIVCHPRTLGKEGKWWAIPRRQVKFKIIVQEDIAIAPFIAEPGDANLAARNLAAHLQRYFTEEIQRHA